MPTKGKSLDRKLVAGGQKHEVAYESKKSGATTTEVKKAIKQVGNSRKKVESKLKSK